MTPETARWYGVSTGNGNDGVSTLHPAYAVFTADPWTLATCAALHEFKAGKGHAWALRHMDVDGEGDYGITVAFDAPPCEDTEDGEYPDLPEGVEWEDAEDGRSWSDGNGTWLLVEIFPMTAEDVANNSYLTYDGETALDDCFGASVVALAKAAT